MVIVITGPIASGKSMIGRRLARELAAAGFRPVVIDLDMLYDLQLHEAGLARDEAALGPHRIRTIECAGG